jgi:DNA-binding MarR family transcriptional regulator
MNVNTGDSTIVTEPMKSSSGKDTAQWSLVTNHGHVLAYISMDCDARLRDLAERVGITERRAAQIVSDLDRAGYLTKTRVGRRNRYQVNSQMTVKAPRLLMTVSQVLAVLVAALDQSHLT